MEDWQQHSLEETVHERKENEENNSKSTREIYDFQSIEVESSTLQQSQTSDTADPLLIHEIKEENFGVNEAIPIQSFTIFIKQEEFGASGYQNDQENGMIETKEELISEEIKEEPQSQDNAHC